MKELTVSPGCTRLIVVLKCRDCTDNVLDKDKIKVDFQPLYQCVHIYISLDSLDDLRTSYQADRKARQLYLDSWTLLILYSGPVGPYSPHTTLFILSPCPLGRNMWLLHYRIPCTGNYFWLPLGKRSRGALGCGRVSIVFSYRFRFGEAKGS